METQFVKSTISSRSEQTFNGAWNRCHVKMNTVTKNHWLIYAATTVMIALSCEMLFQSINQPKTSTPNPCPVDGDDIDDYAKGLQTGSTYMYNKEQPQNRAC